MSHPVFAIIDTISESSDSLFAHGAAGQTEFREQVWNLPVFVSGVDGVGEHGTATQVNFVPGPDGQLQLPVHLHEADAIEHAGAGNYMTLSFGTVVGYTTLQRFDMLLNAGDCVATIPHDLMINLRDTAMLGRPEPAMNDQEQLMLSMASRAVISRACDYCALHDDIDSLNVVMLDVPGLKIMTAMTLAAANFEQHADALRAIAAEVYLPGWRVLVSSDAPDPNSPLAQLDEAPIYLKAARDAGAQRWWQKLFKPSRPPLRDPSVVQVGLLPE